MEPPSSWDRPVEVYSGRTVQAYPSLYRWEFLRRNPQFRADYNKLMSLFGAWLKSRGPRIVPGTDRENWTTSDREYFHAKIEPAVIELCREWQISDVFPPEFSFVETLGALDSGDHRVIPRTWLRVYETENSLVEKELKERGFMADGTRKKIYKNYVLLQFDLNWPMKELLRDAEESLRSAQREYKEWMRLQGTKLPKARRRFDDYDVHLEVWDLRQEGKSYSAIAKEVYGDRCSAESARNRVRDHFKAAKKLILGHYREIR